MPLHPDDAHKTAFTIPGKGQFKWITSPMGLLGYPASFQRMMEKFIRGIPNVIVYIEDLLIHSKNHEDHLVYLEQVLQRLQENHMKLNIEKCFFGNTEVSFLGFVLMGIKPGRDMLRAIKAAQPPTDMKAVRSFIGLCNFFYTHQEFCNSQCTTHKIDQKRLGLQWWPAPKRSTQCLH